MKKAKEYAAQIIESNHSQEVIKQVFHEMVNEIHEVSVARKVKSDKAIRAIILEQQQKWAAICRIVNKQQPVLDEKGFINLLKVAIPETEQILGN